MSAPEELGWTRAEALVFLALIITGSALLGWGLARVMP
jgi:hypothetical protein